MHADRHYAAIGIVLLAFDPQCPGTLVKLAGMHAQRRYAAIRTVLLACNSQVSHMFQTHMMLIRAKP